MKTNKGAIFEGLILAEHVIDFNPNNNHKYLKALESSYFFKYTSDVTDATVDIVEYSTITKDNNNIDVIRYKGIWNGETIIPYSTWKSNAINR